MSEQLQDTLDRMARAVEPIFWQVLDEVEADDE